MRRLTRPLLILLAIVFLFEAWLWSHLEPIVEWIVARIPLRAVKARLAGIVRKLPPAATLVVFIVPVVLLFPLKLLGLWLLAHKHWFARRIGPRPRQARRPRRHRLRVRSDASRSFCSSPGSAGSTSTCWCGSPGRIAWSIRSSAGSGGCCACSGRSGPDARCGCCGASAAACARRAAAQACRSEQMHRVRREQPNRHEGEPEQRRARRRDSVSTTMPVMTVADASTMPIWNAADATS